MEIGGGGEFPEKTPYRCRSSIDDAVKFRKELWECDPGRTAPENWRQVCEGPDKVFNAVSPEDLKRWSLEGKASEVAVMGRFRPGVSFSLLLWREGMPLRATKH